MQLDKYKGVIRRVLERNQGQSPDFVTEKLFEAIEIAQEIAGDLPTSPVSIETPAPVQRPKLAVMPPAPAHHQGPVILSAAPPVAGAEEGEDSEDSVDYWESKPGKGDGSDRLVQALNKILPSSISVKVPSIPYPLELNRRVQGQGTLFVHISYSIAGSDEQGPRFTMMTSQKAIDADAILKDIADQAASFYSAEKRVIQSNPGPKVNAPSAQEMQAALERDMRGRNPNDRSDGLSGKEALEAANDSHLLSGRNSPRWQ